MIPDALLDCIVYRPIAEGEALVVAFADRRWRSDPLAGQILYAASLHWRGRLCERALAVN